jgi:hypothetical protein
MADEPETTASTTDEAPAESTAPAAAPQTSDELEQFKSRNRGLNATVTTLTQERDQLRADLENARKGQTDKEAGDADLRAQLAEANAALETAKKEATLASLKGQYPEAFAELGEGALALTPEKLSSLEARLVVKAAEEETTDKPVGNSPARANSAPKNIEDMTSAELQEAIKKLPREAFGLS